MPLASLWRVIAPELRDGINDFKASPLGALSRYDDIMEQTRESLWRAYSVYRHTSHADRIRQFWMLLTTLRIDQRGHEPLIFAEWPLPLPEQAPSARDAWSMVNLVTESFHGERVARLESFSTDLAGAMKGLDLLHDLLPNMHYVAMSTEVSKLRKVVCETSFVVRFLLVNQADYEAVDGRLCFFCTNADDSN